MDKKNTVPNNQARTTSKTYKMNRFKIIYKNLATWLLACNRQANICVSFDPIRPCEVVWAANICENVTGITKVVCVATGAVSRKV